ncbi:MAG: CPBP family intramembrane glutamic endopeptidase [Halobacteriaceae archaeon]
MSEFERRRLALFVLFAYGVAWAVGAAIYATGGLVDSPALVSLDGGSITLAAVLLPTGYMFAPAVANLATRAITGEGRAGLLLRPRLRAAWRSYAVAWFAPAALVVLGAGLYFALFPRHFDLSMTAFARAVEAQVGGPVDVWTLAAVQVLAAVTVGPLVNAAFAVGEELGWRAYLLPKLLPLGTRRAVLVHGVVWGVWHWPVILMGYEYGFGYPGAPWTGLALFPLFAVAVGTVLAWLTVRSGSVWPAAVGHGAVNAAAGIGALFVTGRPSPLLGPLPVGLVGMVPWLVVAALLLWRTETFAGGRLDDVA